MITLLELPLSTSSLSQFAGHGAEMLARTDVEVRVYQLQRIQRAWL